MLVRDEIPISKLADWGSDTIAVGTSLGIFAKLKLVNVGKARAKIYTFVLHDTSSGDPKLRELLLDKKTREKRLKVVPNLDYFWIKEAKPDDTISFEVSHTVGFMEGDKFTMHFLFLYQNEFKVLFDTYYWARYTYTPAIIGRQYKCINGELYYRDIYNPNELRKCIQFMDHNSSSKIYSREEAADILGFFDKQAKKANLQKRGD